MKFKLESKYKPIPDQARAIAEKLKAGDVGGNDDGFDMGFLKGLMQ